MELLKKLFDTPSVSGYETEMKKVIKDEIQEFCKEIYEDNFGNLIAVTGVGENTTVINVPISEDGLFVTSYKDNSAKCSPIGNFSVSSIVTAPQRRSGWILAAKRDSSA